MVRSASNLARSALRLRGLSLARTSFAGHASGCSCRHCSSSVGGVGGSDGGLPEGASVVDGMLRSTQSAHRLLLSFYRGQDRVQRVRSGAHPLMVKDVAPNEDVQRERELMRFYESELPQRRVRPSALQPAIESVGFLAGAATAALAPDSVARRLSDAVCDSFIEHLEDQLRVLHEPGVRDDTAGIRAKVKEIRDADRALAKSAQPEEEEEAFMSTGDIMEDLRQQLLRPEQMVRTGIKLSFQALVGRTKTI